VRDSVRTALYTLELPKQSIVLRRQLLVLCLLLLLKSSVLPCFRVQLHLHVLNLMLHSCALSSQLLHMSLLGMLCLSIQTTDAALDSIQHPLHVCAVLLKIKGPLLLGLKHLLKLTLLYQLLLKLLLQLLVVLLCMLGVSWCGQCRCCFWNCGMGSLQSLLAGGSSLRSLLCMLLCQLSLQQQKAPSAASRRVKVKARVDDIVAMCQEWQCAL